MFIYNTFVLWSFFLLFDLTFFQKLIKDALIVCTGGTVLFAGASVYQGQEKFYRQCVMPFFQLFDAETSHKMAVKAAKYKLVPKPRKPIHPILVCYIFCLSYLT